jgi:hypothetical protein
MNFVSVAQRSRKVSVVPLVRWMRGALLCFLLSLLPDYSHATTVSLGSLFKEISTTTSRSLRLSVEFVPSDSRWVQSVIERTDTARRILNSRMPDALLTEIHVIIAPDKNVFLQLTGGWAEHSSAVALPSAPVPTIIINAEALRSASPVEFSRTLIHELSHLYVGLRFKMPAPRWFDEGVAFIAADQWSFEDQVAIALAAFLNRTIPLRELTHHFPYGSPRQRLAYQESASVVRLLMNENGGSLKYFLRPYIGPQGKELLSALWNPLYTDPLELRWKSSLRSWRNLGFLVYNSGAFWIAVAVLTILAWFLKRRRNLLRRQEWEEEERILSSLDDEEDASENFEEFVDPAENDDDEYRGLQNKQEDRD